MTYEGFKAWFALGILETLYLGFEEESYGDRVVDEQKAEGFPVEHICDGAGVSTSTYCDWKKHRCGFVTNTERVEQLLVSKIRLDAARRMLVLCSQRSKGVRCIS